MSDTIQIVSWALERPCPYRHGDTWFLPRSTYAQLAGLKAIADAATFGRVVDGICITSWGAQRIPSDGFRIEDKLGPDGLSKSLSVCGACEANAKAELKIPIAGCCDYLHVWLGVAEMEEVLWRVLKDRRLEQRFFSAFPRTKPLWYGLWINSPLRVPQVELLAELLPEVFDCTDPRAHYERHFLSALDAAKQFDLPLHVYLPPPGHVDLGWYTVFPHCPRCKADAGFEPWQNSYPKEAHRCRVCEHVFIPDEHHKSEPDESDYDKDDLKKQMGVEEYWRFVRTVLLGHGRPVERVDEIIAKRRREWEASG